MIHVKFINSLAYEYERTKTIPLVLDYRVVIWLDGCDWRSCKDLVICVNFQKTSQTAIAPEANVTVLDHITFYA